MPPTRAALVQRLQDLSEQFIGLGIESGLCRIRVEDEVLSGDLITVDDRKLLNFGTAAYLGLNTDPRLKRGAIEAIERFGPVFSSSPVYTSADLYGHLEERMERIFDAPVILPTMPSRAGPVMVWKPGRESRTPSVSTHPGCIELTETPEPSSSVAQTLARTTSPRFVRAYAAVGA